MGKFNVLQFSKAVIKTIFIFIEMKLRVEWMNDDEHTFEICIITEKVQGPSSFSNE